MTRLKIDVRPSSTRSLSPGQGSQVNREVISETATGKAVGGRTPEFRGMVTDLLNLVNLMNPQKRGSPPRFTTLNPCICNNL